MKEGVQMNLFRNMKVKTKLIGAFLILALLIGIVGGVGVVSLGNVKEKGEVIYSRNLQSVYFLTTTKIYMAEGRSDLLKLVFQKDPSKKDSIKENFNLNKDNTTKFIEEYSKLVSSSSESELLSTLN